jgi:hypothetical protein
VLESVAGPAFEAEVEVELALSSFDDEDFDRERGGALLLAALLASEEEAGGGPWLLSELLLLLAAAAFDGWLLSLLFEPCELLSDQRGGGADWLCGGACGSGIALLASAAVLLLTSPAKISLPPGDESGACRANLDGALENMLVAASGVTLCTEGL